MDPRPCRKGSRRHGPASRATSLSTPLLALVLLPALAAISLPVGAAAVPPPADPIAALAGAGRTASASTSAVHPDFNGDGFADLAVGVPKENINGSRDAGAVNVIYGSADGLTAQGNQFWHQDSPGILDRAEDLDNFGASLAAADFNGDGFDDLAVGARGENLGGVDLAGAVNVIYGSAAGLTAGGNQFWHQDSEGILNHVERGDRFAWTLAAGDFDADGFADLAIGMRFEDVGGAANAGAVNVIYGSAVGLTAKGNQFWTQDSEGIPDSAEDEDQMGWALAVGDFDGDDFDDLAIGAAYESRGAHRGGAVHIIFGSARGLRARGTQIWTQDSPGILERAELRDQFGQSLTAGDFDGDGFDDLAVGVWFEDYCWICNQGGVHVIYGSARGLTAKGNQFWNQDSSRILDSADPFDRFGHALAAGDFDADGFEDLAMGAPREGLRTVRPFYDHGGVNVFYGTARGLRAARNQFWTQDSPGIREVAHRKDLFGLALAAADFDADGASDLAVGTRFEDNAVIDGGSVNVIYGTTRGLRAARNQLWTQDSPGILDQAEKGDRFGWNFPGHRSASGTTGDQIPDYWR